MKLLKTVEKLKQDICTMDTFGVIQYLPSKLKKYKKYSRIRFADTFSYSTITYFDIYVLDLNRDFLEDRK